MVLNNFKILLQGTSIAIEQLCFQIYESISYLVPFLLLVEFIFNCPPAFKFLFSYWLMNTLKFSGSFWKNEMGSLVAFGKLQKHVI